VRRVPAPPGRGGLAGRAAPHGRRADELAAPGEHLDELLMDMETLLLLGLGLGPALAFMLPYHRRQQRLERETEEAELKALRYGLHEPVSLHPVVDAESCIGTGNCVAACPEETVLGIR